MVHEIALEPIQGRADNATLIFIESHWDETSRQLAPSSKPAYYQKPELSGPHISYACIPR